MWPEAHDIDGLGIAASQQHGRNPPPLPRCSHWTGIAAGANQARHAQSGPNGPMKLWPPCFNKQAIDPLSRQVVAATIRKPLYCKSPARSNPSRPARAHLGSGCPEPGTTHRLDGLTIYHSEWKLGSQRRLMAFANLSRWHGVEEKGDRGGVVEDRTLALRTWVCEV
jgi:hypothetical protein